MKQYPCAIIEVIRRKENKYHDLNEIADYAANRGVTKERINPSGFGHNVILLDSAKSVKPLTEPNSTSIRVLSMDYFDPNDYKHRCD